MVKKPGERRAEPRTKPVKFHSVEFRAFETRCLYQFKIWNVSSKGLCLLVREDSGILDSLHIGDVLDMKYYPDDMSEPPRMLKTKIMHITLENQGRFKEHYLVGLLVLNPNAMAI